MRKSCWGEFVGAGRPVPDGDERLRLSFKINHGPDIVLDRILHSEIDIVEFAKRLPVNTAVRLYRELLKHKVDKMSEATKGEQP